jgi:hypothetical protein
MDHHKVCAREDLHRGGHQGVEGWHAGDADDAGTVESGVSRPVRATREAERVGDVDEAVGHRGKVLQKLAVVGGGRPNH